MNQTNNVRDELRGVRMALIATLKELEEYRSCINTKYGKDDPMYAAGAWSMHCQADELLKRILERTRWQV